MIGGDIGNEIGGMIFTDDMISYADLHLGSS
jgi:hypothetical protein